MRTCDLEDNVGAAAANMFWIVRTTGDPMLLASGLAREMRRLDPEVVASQIRPMDHYLSDAVAPRQFNLSLMAAFAMAALALAVTGIYAVVMYSINQRSRELGIRMALGANRSNIVWLVMGHGLRFIGLGLVSGIALAVVSTRLLSTMLFGVTATDVATFVQVTVIVTAISLVACALPTARVARLAVSALTSE